MFMSVILNLIMYVNVFRPCTIKTCTMRKAWNRGYICTVYVSLSQMQLDHSIFECHFLHVISQLPSLDTTALERVARAPAITSIEKTMAMHSECGRGREGEGRGKRGGGGGREGGRGV